MSAAMWLVFVLTQPRPLFSRRSRLNSEPSKNSILALPMPLILSS